MRKAISIAVLAALAGTNAAATDLVDTALVISSTPVVERVVEPRQDCSAGPAAAPAQPQNRDFSGAVIGGIAGGLLGAQVGKGNGKTAAAAVGAAAGAIIGDHVQNTQRAAQAPAPVCRTVETTREVIRGYTVVYRYNDRDITTTLPYDPGPTVRVAVGVIENAPAAAAPAPGPMGANVREVRAPVSATTGGYPYRY